MRAALPHPFERVPARARRRALLALALLTLAIGLRLAWLDAGLRTPAAPHGIVSFEFAGTRENAARMLADWGAPGIHLAVRIQRLDFLFLAAYASTLALLCAAAADGARAAGSRLAAPGAALAWGQLAAGGLDAIENVALLRVLAGSSAAAWPPVAAACAAPKFALVGAGIAFLIFYGIRRIRTRNDV